MASIVYPMLLFIFIFAALTAGVNELGIWEERLPTSGASVQMQEVQEINAAMVNTTNPVTAAWQQLNLLGKCAIAGFTAIFTLGPLMKDYGINPGIYGMLLSPMGFVFLMYLGEWWLGRSPE